MTNTASAPIAIVTARAARALDEDLPPFEAALRQCGATFERVDWGDAQTDWSRFRMAVVRSTWDYALRLPEFLAWAERASRATALMNPAEVIRWSTDKHYLEQLLNAGAPVVPSEFVEPGDDAAAALDGFLSRHVEEEIVIKPTVSAGARDTNRHARRERTAMLAHISSLLSAGRSVLLQPYFASVDEAGETSLIYFDGKFSHAIRKGPLLRRGEAATKALFAAERIDARTPTVDELRAAQRVLVAMPFENLLYARVDLIRDADGAPCLLELELAEPSLFFDRAPGAAERFVECLLRRQNGR